METLSLKLSPREVVGKKVRMLRREGIIPVHLFGKGAPSQSLQLDAGALRRVLPQAGANVPITVEVEGQEGQSTCFVREVQRHPVTSELLHVDFLSVDVSQTITVEVPVILDGRAPGVENMGGILLQPAQTLPVEALPMDVPASFHLDVSGLDDFEKSLRISDIEVGPNVAILRDEEEMVARVVAPRIEEEPKIGAEEGEEGLEGELAEGEEPAEGEPGEQQPDDSEQRG